MILWTSPKLKWDGDSEFWLKAGRGLDSYDICANVLWDRLKLPRTRHARYWLVVHDRPEKNSFLGKIVNPRGWLYAIIGETRWGWVPKKWHRSLRPLVGKKLYLEVQYTEGD